MESLDSVSSEIIDAIATADSLDVLEAIRIDALGKKGRISLMMRELGGMDAEDPTCGRLHLTGTLKPITSKDDLTKAKAYLGEKHPLAPWLAAGGAHTGGTYNTIEIKSLTFLDYYGGPAKLSVEDYLTAKLD